MRFSGDIGIRWYGLAYVAAFAGGWALYRHLAVKGYSELKPDQVGDFITWAAILGVMLGGRLGYVFLYQPDILLENPLALFRVWEGGMSSHGGMIGLVIFTYVYARRHKVSWTGVGDNLCVVAPIGLFLGRMANFINGELYGRVSTVPWAVYFPREKFDEATLALARDNPEIRESIILQLQARHPSQIYEGLLEGVVLFAILWWVRTGCRVPNGVLTGLFFAVYAVFRTFVEFYREPDAGLILGMTRGQFYSLFILLLGVAFIVRAYRKPQYAPCQRTEPIP